MARVLASHRAFVPYGSSRTLELDSALLLAGLATPPGPGRYVFHTTYVNGDVDEYHRLAPECRLIWMLRRPESVVYSMLYNWSSRALDALFASCGTDALPADVCARYARWGRLAVRRPLRAASAYAGKTAQVVDLARVFGPQRLMIVEYDEFVRDPAPVMQRVCRFLDIDMDAAMIAGVHRSSLRHGDRLPPRIADLVNRLCAPVYASSLEVMRQLDAAREGTA
jgi:hypothetical protein